MKRRTKQTIKRFWFIPAQIIGTIFAIIAGIYIKNSGVSVSLEAGLVFFFIIFCLVGMFSCIPRR